MTSFDAAQYGDKLLAARALDAKPIAIPASMPLTADHAYAVQDYVRSRSGPVAAWKVGAPNPTAEPTCAPILSSGLNTIDARSHRPGTAIGVELEVAFRLGRDFAAASTAPTGNDVLSAIEGAYIAIETCYPRHVVGLQAPPLCTLADNGINHGLLLGQRIDNWQQIPAATLQARMEIDGQTVADTTGGHSHGDILALLIWQIGHCVTKRGGLARGTVVTTGSWTGIAWAQVPAQIRGTFPGFASMDLSLIAAPVESLAQKAQA